MINNIRSLFVTQALGFSAATAAAAGTTPAIPLSEKLVNFGSYIWNGATHTVTLCEDATVNTVSYLRDTMSSWVMNEPAKLHVVPLYAPWIPNSMNPLNLIRCQYPECPYSYKEVFYSDSSNPIPAETTTTLWRTTVETVNSVYKYSESKIGTTATDVALIVAGGTLAIGTGALLVKIARSFNKAHAHA